nr:MAG TPA_asm: Large Terminase [Caudoviricetes sp.]
MIKLNIPFEFPSDDARNKWLLYHYLKKSYTDIGIPEEKAEELTDNKIIENSKNLFGFHGLAYQLGQISLEFFCLYFLQDIYLPKEDNAAAPMADVHRELWSDIQESIIGDGPEQLGRVLPRGTGKSAFGTLGPTCWVVAYKHKTYVLICSDIGSTAEKFIKDIKDNMIENSYIEQAFGKILDDKNRDFICNATQLEFTNKTFVEAISSTSPMRGRKYKNVRPDLIILDDYQSEDDCRTEEAREKKWKKYSDDVKFAKQRPIKRDGKVIKKGTVLMAWGTQQHKECFYSRLIKAPTWTFKKEKGVLVESVDEYFNSGLWLEFKNTLNNFKNENRLYDAKEFYYEHQNEMQFKTLWSEFWDCLELALDYFENPNSFKQEVQGDVDAIGEKWFKRINTEPRKVIESHEFIKTMIIVDPASSGGKKNDYSAFLVGSEGINKCKYARKAELAKINARNEFDKYIDHIIELLLEYTDATHVSIEKNTFNGADANQLEKKIREHDILKYRNITIINEMQRRNKDDKISTIVPYVNNGTFIFAEEDEEFVNQLMEFAGQKFTVHDDAADVSSEFWLKVDEIKVASTVKLLDRKLLGL